MKRIRKCEPDERGFINPWEVATVVEEIQLFLKSRSNYANEENTTESEPIAGTSAGSGRSTASFAGSKRKVNDHSDDDESTKNDDGSTKRRKNEINDEINFIEEDENVSVEESLFSNDLLLRTIFAHLNFNDLKSCRRVNPIWNNEATKILQKRGNLAAIQIIDETVEFYDAAVYKRPISLQDFQNLTAKSTFFPVSTFITGNNPMSFKTESFLRDSGHFVESLQCKSEEKKVHSTDILALLLLLAQSLPNLKILKLGGKFDSEASAAIERDFDAAPEMKNLHTLELCDHISHHAMAMLLKKAPNLQNIYLRKDIDASLVEHRNVIPRLKNIRLVFSLDGLRIFEKIARENPKFMSVDMIRADREDIPEMQAQVGRVLTELFEKCSETLTQILGVRPLGNIPELTFPVFLNVQRLGFDCKRIPLSPGNSPPCVPLLPSGFDLAETFPNLTTVEFHFPLDRSWGRYSPEDILPAALSPVLSVKNLKLYSASGKIQRGVIERICIKFPNVTSAKFDTMLADDAYEYIWELSQLQELQILILAQGFLKVSALDSAFTGFAEETVKEMLKKNLGDVNLSEREVRFLRVHPSIVDLKDLRKITIRVDLYSVSQRGEFYNRGSMSYPDSLRKKDILFDPGYGKTLLQVQEKPLLSYITKRFGFDLCPELNSNVFVRFEHYAKLV